MQIETGPTGAVSLVDGSGKVTTEFLTPMGAAARPCRHSIPSGDVVLCNVPPYNTPPWLATGVVVHAALLAQVGLRTRVVRPIDPPFVVPPGVMHA